ncbi:hypothetical protein ACH5RR_041034 [Cinchona calisaya]|uniref:Uncharacterized protein n=1 Tax=Cinchona calisaya TaxID=153742 RepID=A0ABD2XXM4_9GENT
MLTIIKGPRSYEEDMKVDGIMHPTFEEACRALGLNWQTDEEEFTWIDIPEYLLILTSANFVYQIINSMYPNLLAHHNDPSHLNKRTILPLENDVVDKVNFVVLSPITVASRVYLSADRIFPNTGYADDQSPIYPGIKMEDMDLVQIGPRIKTTTFRYSITLVSWKHPQVSYIMLNIDEGSRGNPGNKSSFARVIDVLSTVIIGIDDRVTKVLSDRAQKVMIGIDSMIVVSFIQGISTIP